MEKIRKYKLKNIKFICDEGIELNEDDKLTIVKAFIETRSKSKLKKVYRIHVSKSHRPKKKKLYYCVAFYLKDNYTKVQSPFFV